jgi:hypothetical protein
MPFDLDWRILWDAAISDIPDLAAQKSFVLPEERFGSTAWIARATLG